MRGGRNKGMALAPKDKIKKNTPEGQGRRRDAEAAGVGRLSDKDRERAEELISRLSMPVRDGPLLMVRTHPRQTLGAACSSAVRA
jgi:hypothetical protein